MTATNANEGCFGEGDGDAIGVARALDDLGVTLADVVPELTLTGTLAGLRRGSWWTYADLVAHDRAHQVTARVPLAIRPATLSTGKLPVGTVVAVTGRFVVSRRFGPVQFEVVHVERSERLAPAASARHDLERRIEREGLDSFNSARRLGSGVSRVAVVCPIGGGAGAADLEAGLRASGVGWEVRSLPVSMTSSTSARDVAAAIGRAARSDVDVVVVCRGGGAAADLALFDAEMVVDAIVAAAVPVVVAVGHAGDRHLADRVAYASVATPTAAATWLITHRAPQLAPSPALASMVPPVPAAALASRNDHQRDGAAPRRRPRVVAVACVLVAAALAVLFLLLLHGGADFGMELS